MSIPHAKRVCQIIKLKPEHESAYIKAHTNVWPEVLAALAKSNIVDYSIHYYKPLELLIANFKYTGADYEKDMAEIAADSKTQEWWHLTDKMQASFQDNATGSGGSVPWWTDLHEVFESHPS